MNTESKDNKKYTMDKKTDRRKFMKCMAFASLGIAAGGLGCSKVKKTATSDKPERSEMNEMIAFCGIKCQECGAFIATLNDDDVKRREVAAEWGKMYNADIKPEDINCEGCISLGETLFSHCNVCEIRKCAKEKEVLNCAYCSEYACDKLNKFFEMAPDARVTLDGIRATLS